MFEPTAEEIVRCFNQWELSASHGGYPSTTPPTLQEAAALVPKLQEWRDRLEREGEWRDEAVFHLAMQAMGCCWEAWRSDVLGESNAYRDIWTAPDPLYDGTAPGD